MKLGTKAALAVGCIGVLVLGSFPVLAADATCSLCAEGNHWIDTCAAGSDAIAQQSALVGIDTDLDCVADTSLVLGTCGTDFIIDRDAPVGHTIATEIVNLCLTNGAQTMIAGAGLGQGGVLAATLGEIVEQGGDDTVGDSTFDMFFEFDLGGGNFVYNHTPLVISSEITCVPPQAKYLHPDGCTPLFDNPTPGMGTLVANLVSANHIVGPIPTVSEWGVVAMVLVLMAAGTIVIRRFRRVPA